LTPVNTRLHPGITIGFVKNWIYQNYAEFMIPFYDYIIQPTGANRPNIGLVSDGLLRFCTLLLEMEQTAFDVKLASCNDEAIVGRSEAPRGG
jgi:hypothetical protein